jgi:hypothetical protein
MPKAFRMLIFVFVTAVTAYAQSGPTCQVYTDSVTPNCSASGWDTGLPSFTCAHRTVKCPSVGSVNIADNGITIGYAAPSTVNGTIVFLSNSGGTSPELYPGNEGGYAGYYYSQHFQVVQTAWDSDWEDTGTGNVKNVAYAAGRVAAFLSWVRYGSSTGGTALYGSGGMCIHGTSAGGAAGAFVLAWYGGDSYIDKLAALSGPTLSNIAQGCKVGAIINQAVCPSGQLGCNSSNAVTTWNQPPTYTDGKSNVRTWTGDPTCGGNYTTSGSSYTAWNAMSIVDGTVAKYDYPKTNITSWICANAYSSDGLNDGVMNNSSPQAQLFFQNFTSQSQISGLTINAITSCNGTEGVSGPYATPPGNYVALGYTTGTSAIQYDMTTDQLNLCKARH